MTTKLMNYFPTIKTREEVLRKVRSDEQLCEIFHSWKPSQQEEFLNFTTGVKGLKLLYDSFFKEIFNPETVPERLEDFLSLLLGKKIEILEVLPNDSTRIADETSLLITDIVVKLEDGSLANLEIQKIGYAFPGERSACYSADLLLRQYKRVRSEKKKENRMFSYRDVKDVYTIVLFETSPKEMQEFSKDYIHFFEQKCDTGLRMNLLQKYYFISLDIFREVMHNYSVTTKLDAWLGFLSIDEPEFIIALIEQYPEFRSVYQHIYDMCQNIEGVMKMFSKELQELDRNTVRYMMDEMQAEIDHNMKIIQELKTVHAQQVETIARKEAAIAENRETIAKREATIAENRETIAKREATIAENRETIAKREATIAENRETIAKKEATIAENRETIAKREATIAEDRETIAKNEKMIAEKERLYQEALKRIAQLEQERG